jgi:hypothetical protein
MYQDNQDSFPALCLYTSVNPSTPEAGLRLYSKRESNSFLSVTGITSDTPSAAGFSCANTPTSSDVSLHFGSSISSRLKSCFQDWWHPHPVDVSFRSYSIQQPASSGALFDFNEVDFPPLPHRDPLVLGNQIVIQRALTFAEVYALPLGPQDSSRFTQPVLCSKRTPLEVGLDFFNLGPNPSPLELAACVARNMEIKEGFSFRQQQDLEFLLQSCYRFKANLTRSELMHSIISRHVTATSVGGGSGFMFRHDPLFPPNAPATMHTHLGQKIKNLIHLVSSNPIKSDECSSSSLVARTPQPPRLSLDVDALLTGPHRDHVMKAVRSLKKLGGIREFGKYHSFNNPTSIVQLFTEYNEYLVRVKGFRSSSTRKASILNDWYHTKDVIDGGIIPHPVRSIFVALGHRLGNTNFSLVYNLTHTKLTAEDREWLFVEKQGFDVANIVATILLSAILAGLFQRFIAPNIQKAKSLHTAISWVTSAGEIASGLLDRVKSVYNIVHQQISDLASQLLQYVPVDTIIRKAIIVVVSVAVIGVCFKLLQMAPDLIQCFSSFMLTLLPRAACLKIEAMIDTTTDEANPQMERQGLTDFRFGDLLSVFTSFFPSDSRIDEFFGKGGFGDRLPKFFRFSQAMEYFAGKIRDLALHLYSWWSGQVIASNPQEVQIQLFLDLFEDLRSRQALCGSWFSLFKAEPDSHDELGELLTSHKVIAAAYLTGRTTLNPRIISMFQAKAKEVERAFDDHRKFKFNCGRRRTPILCYIYGDAGVGKTYIAEELFALVKLCMEEDETDERNRKRYTGKFSFGSDVYNVNQADEYHDSYHNEAMAYYDDLFQKKEARENAIVALTLINIIGPNVTPLLVADMNMKGKTFNADFLIATGNKSSWREGLGIQNPEALHDRRALVLELCMDDEGNRYLKPSLKQPDGITRAKKHVIVIDGKVPERITTGEAARLMVGLFLAQSTEERTYQLPPKLKNTKVVAPRLSFETEDFGGLNAPSVVHTTEVEPSASVSLSHQQFEELAAEGLVAAESAPAPLSPAQEYVSFGMEQQSLNDASTLYRNIVLPYRANLYPDVFNDCAPIADFFCLDPMVITLIHVREAQALLARWKLIASRVGPLNDNSNPPQLHDALALPDNVQNRSDRIVYAFWYHPYGVFLHKSALAFQRAVPERSDQWLYEFLSYQVQPPQPWMVEPDPRRACELYNESIIAYPRRPWVLLSCWEALALGQVHRSPMNIESFLWMRFKLTMAENAKKILIAVAAYVIVRSLISMVGSAISTYFGRSDILLEDQSGSHKVGQRLPRKVIRAPIGRVVEIKHQSADPEFPPTGNPQVDPVMRAVQRNLVYCNFGNHCTNFVLGVADGLVLVNRHSIQGMEQDDVILFACDGRGSQTEIAWCDVRVLEIETGQDAEGTPISQSLLVFLWLPNSKGRFRNISSHFSSSDEVAGIISRIMPVVTDDRNFALIQHSTERYTVTPGKSFAGADATFYNMPNDKGYCGLPYFAVTKQGTKITFIHEAGDKSANVAIGIAIHRATVLDAIEACKQFAISLVETKERFDGSTPDFPMLVQQSKMCTGTEPLGSFPAESKISLRQPTESSLRMSLLNEEHPMFPLQDEQGPITLDFRSTRIPAVLFPVDGVGGLNYPLNKFHTVSGLANVTPAIEPALYIGLPNDQHVPVTFRPSRCRELTYEEAIFGCPQLNIPALDLTTSAGYGKANRGKNRLQTIFSGPGILDSAFKNECLALYAELRYMVVPQISMLSLKDELIDRDSVAKGKCRTIHVGELKHAIVGRMILGTLLSELMSTPTETVCSTGLNPHGMDWARLFARITKHGYDTLAGDISGQEFSIPHELLIEFCEFLDEIHPLDEFKAMARRNYIVSCAWPEVVLLRRVFTFSKGQGSGWLLTQLLASWITDRYYRMFARHLGISDDTYTRNVESSTLGDDSIIGVNTVNMPGFTMSGMSLFCRDYLGVVYTTFDKKDASTASDYVNILEVEYLKRSFRPVGRLVLAPLRMSSIYEIALWETKNWTNDDFLNSMRSIMVEMRHYSCAEYERIRSVISRYTIAVGVPLVIPTYHSAFGNMVREYDQQLPRRDFPSI